jgi:hypothetical protein
MKKTSLILLSAVLVCSCLLEDPVLSEADEAAIGLNRSSMAIGDSVTGEVTLMAVGDSVKLLSASGNRYPANSFLLVGGELGKAYKSDADGDNWTLSYGGTYYYGGIGDVNALCWSRRGNQSYNNWRICIAAGTNGIWYYNATSDYWWPLYQEEGCVFTAVNTYQDPHGYAAFWDIAGFRDSIPCMYEYMYYQGGSTTSFTETDATMFEHKITSMASTMNVVTPKIAVTDGGEIVVTSMYPYEIVYNAGYPLYASATLAYHIYDIRVFVGGDNGFLSYADETDWYSWTMASSGITNRINAIATNTEWYDSDVAPLVVAGSNGGQFSYSVDGGETFIPYDIGFGASNINDIAYYEYDSCFYAVGDHGKIARIKITVN